MNLTGGPCAHCHEPLPRTTYNRGGTAMHRDCKSASAPHRPPRMCPYCGEPLVSAGAMHLACRIRHEQETNYTICVCPGDRVVETFWMGRQCGRCGRAFLDDLRPDLARAAAGIPRPINP